LIEVADKPLTIIYSGARNLASNLLAEDGSVGIRVTNEDFSRRLCQQQQNNGNGQQQQPQQQRFGYAQQDKNGKYQFTQANAGGNSQNQSRDAYNNSYLTYCQYANAQMEKMSQCIEQGNYKQAYDWSLGAMDNLKRIQSGISKDSANGQQ
jgi:hypothetical protein